MAKSAADKFQQTVFKFFCLNLSYFSETFIIYLLVQLVDLFDQMFQVRNRIKELFQDKNMKTNLFVNTSLNKLIISFNLATYLKDGIAIVL